MCEAIWWGDRRDVRGDPVRQPSTAMCEATWRATAGAISEDTVPRRRPRIRRLQPLHELGLGPADLEAPLLQPRASGRQPRASGRRRSASRGPWRTPRRWAPPARRRRRRARPARRRRRAPPRQTRRRRRAPPRQTRRRRRSRRRRARAPGRRRRRAPTRESHATLRRRRRRACRHGEETDRKTSSCARPPLAATSRLGISTWYPAAVPRPAPRNFHVAPRGDAATRPTEYPHGAPRRCRDPPHGISTWHPAAAP